MVVDLEKRLINFLNILEIRKTHKKFIETFQLYIICCNSTILNQA